jgi:hypothetical protein
LFQQANDTTSPVTNVATSLQKAAIMVDFIKKETFLKQKQYSTSQGDDWEKLFEGLMHIIRQLDELQLALNGGCSNGVCLDPAEVITKQFQAASARSRDAFCRNTLVSTATKLLLKSLRKSLQDL